jgi:hypothetical protein
LKDFLPSVELAWGGLPYRGSTLLDLSVLLWVGGIFTATTTSREGKMVVLLPRIWGEEDIVGDVLESTATRKAIIQGSCDRFFYDGMAHCPLVLVGLVFVLLRILLV